MNTKHPDNELSQTVKKLGTQLGFQQIGISQAQLQNGERELLQWLDQGMHGDMQYMAKHGVKRCRPADLIPGTLSVICARMNYRCRENPSPRSLLDQPEKAYISRYALGRDYHKVVRKRLLKLVAAIGELTGDFQYRVFADSAPVMEKPLAVQAGLGWQGKHTNLLNREHGSWFFLGEIYTDLPLLADKPVANHCGDCHACMDACPTGAIIGPYQLDARRCISYLTIEYKGVIPEPYRLAMGNRIYGCDDCQLVCPWNRFAPYGDEQDFVPRHSLDRIDLLDLFSWDETTYLRKTEGMAIRRINHEQWLRNIAVALGNANHHPDIVAALQKKRQQASELLAIHIDWALSRQCI